MLLLQVCTFSEALAEGAIKMGMPSDLAHRIAAQTLLVSEGFLGRVSERFECELSPANGKTSQQTARQAGEMCSCLASLFSCLPRGQPRCCSRKGSTQPSFGQMCSHQLEPPSMGFMP